MTQLQQIVEWNKSRNLNSFNKETEIRLLSEELQEFVDSYTIHDLLDSMADIIVVATGTIHKLGYNPDLVLAETIKEITSRQGSIDPSTGKWQKDINQNPSTLYKANYAGALL